MSEDRGQQADTEGEELEEAEEAEIDDEDAEDGVEGDADAHDEGQEGQEGQRDDVAPPKRPTRGARRIASLSEGKRKAEQEAAELRGRLQALEGRQQVDPYAAQRQAEMEQAELQRIAQLPYEDQIAFHTRRTETRVSQALQRQEFLITDRLDKQGFDALARQDPIARRLQKEVEQLRMQNPAIPREAILNHLYGQEMRQKAAAAADKQRRAGRNRIARETTQPGQARGNASPTGRNRDDSIEAVKARLRGQTF